MVSTLTERGAGRHAARAGTGRGGLRRQAEDRRRRRPAPPRRRDHREDPASPPVPACTGWPAGGGKRAGAVARPRADFARAPVDREDHLHRRLHRRHRGHARGADAAAARRAGGDDHAAHAARLHEAAMRRGWTACAASAWPRPDGERVLPGHAYIAPGGLHLSVGALGANHRPRARMASRSTATSRRSRCCSSPRRAWSAQRAGRDAHRHGRRTAPGDARDARRRQSNIGAGRGQLRRRSACRAKPSRTARPTSAAAGASPRSITWLRTIATPATADARCSMSRPRSAGRQMHEQHLPAHGSLRAVEAARRQGAIPGNPPAPCPVGHQQPARHGLVRAPR